jgi:RimJ/RimL family protein N-acetyltransferase
LLVRAGLWKVATLAPFPAVGIDIRVQREYSSDHLGDATLEAELLREDIDGPLPTAYTGRSVLLRPMSRHDYGTMLSWRSDMLDLHVWSSSRRIPTLDEFSNEMDSLMRQTITLMALDKNLGLPAGFVQAYNINQADGWCYFLTYLAPDYRRQRLGAEAALAFFDYLFRNFNLRKIYMDVYEFNSGFLSLATDISGFVEEGRFKSHVWYGDRFWDVVRLALYREAWPEFRDVAERVLQVEDEAAEVVARREKHNLAQAKNS